MGASTTDLPPQLIRRYRRDENLSQAELAARLGVDSSSVARWETGRSTPTGTAALVLRAAIARYRMGTGTFLGATAVGLVGLGPLGAALGLFTMLRKSLEEAGAAESAAIRNQAGEGENEENFE